MAHTIKANSSFRYLAKNPNMFNHIGQIFIDTSVFAPKAADSLGNVIMEKIQEWQRQLQETWPLSGAWAAKPLPAAILAG